MANSPAKIIELPFKVGANDRFVPSVVEEPRKFHERIPGAIREWIVFHEGIGMSGMWLNLDGPFCYPRWLVHWRYATALTRCRAYAFAGALGGIVVKVNESGTPNLFREPA